MTLLAHLSASPRLLISHDDDLGLALLERCKYRVFMFMYAHGSVRADSFDSLEEERNDAQMIPFSGVL